LPADRFCEKTSPTYFPSIQTDMAIISLYGKGLYLGNFKAWRFYTRLFIFRKIVIVLFKYRLSILEKTIIIFKDTKRKRDVGIRVSYQIKWKRERKREAAKKRRKKLSLFFSYTWNYVFVFCLS